MNNQPEKHFIKVLSRSFLIIINKLNNGYEVLAPKFNNVYCFDKDKDKAIEKVKYLVEARVRLLIRDIVKVVEHEKGGR
jgi:hypothetical protein